MDYKKELQRRICKLIKFTNIRMPSFLNDDWGVSKLLQFAGSLHNISDRIQ